MHSTAGSFRCGRCPCRSAFSLAELLVVVGVIALLASIIAPPLQLARRQAMQTRCAANLQQLGVALEAARVDHDDFYPLWDDGNQPIRYTWIDVLVQQSLLGSAKVGYCPEDARPDAVNEARAEFFGLLYPGASPTPGIDYSYGIGVPLSAGGWYWRRGLPGDDGNHQRLFEGHMRDTSNRVLAGDASWSSIYNLSGDYLSSGIWNDPTQFDNTVAWQRHRNFSANFLMQDGHVGRTQYSIKAEQPVNTIKYCVWYPGEPLYSGPDTYHNGNYYPNQPPIDLENGLYDGPFPRDLLPTYYTRNRLWTRIQHK
ncbi:MAG: type II secretion system protein [Planctomycetota bacterium]